MSAQRRRSSAPSSLPPAEPPPDPQAAQVAALLDPEPEPPPLLALAEAVAGLDEQQRGDVLVYVYDLEPDGPERPAGVPAYVRKYRGELDVDTIKADLGGGTYRLLVRIGKTLLGKTVVRIAGPRRSHEAPAPVEAPAPSAPPAQLAPNAQAQLAQQLELLQSLVSLVNVIRPPQAESGVSAVLDAAVRIQELVRSERSEQSETGQILSAVRELLPVLPQLTNRAPAPEAAAPAAALPGAAAPGEQEMLSIYQGELQRIARAALADDDPTFWSEYVIRVAPPLVSLIAQAGPEGSLSYVLDFVRARPELVPPEQLGRVEAWTREVIGMVYAEATGHVEPPGNGEHDQGEQLAPAAEAPGAA